MDFKRIEMFKRLCTYLPHNVPLVGSTMNFDIVHLERWTRDEQDITLILKPLSDLSKIDFSEYLFSSSQLNELLLLERLEVTRYDILSQTSYEIVNFCLENHFDIFGMIESGDAVSEEEFER
jgi:hypothetical protein